HGTYVDLPPHLEERREDILAHLKPLDTDSKQENLENMPIHDTILEECVIRRQNFGRRFTYNLFCKTW
ncbi:hypothetical protein OHE92_24170, partial [Escherichia coli]|nr:hypothetical protein [Escherichia coli]